MERAQADINAARLLEEADQISRARLLAAARRESGLWLHTLPTSILGSLCIVIALRVAAGVCELPHVPLRWENGCKRSSRFSCKFSAGWYSRHAALNNIIKRGLQSAGVPSILEPVTVDRRDGKRPDGITVFPFYNKRSMCWDDPCTDANADSSAVSVRYAACSAGGRGVKAPKVWGA